MSAQVPSEPGLAKRSRVQRRRSDVAGPGGTFGTDSDHLRIEVASHHHALVPPFRIDLTPCANRHFREFVQSADDIASAETVPDAKAARLRQVDNV